MKDFIDQYKQLRDAQFTDKETYLEWVSQWQMFYEELSQYIRKVKMTIRKRMRNSEFGGSYTTTFIDLEKSPLWQVQGHRERLRICAVDSLDLRMCNKELSQRMKQEQLELVS